MGMQFLLALLFVSVSWAEKVGTGGPATNAPVKKSPTTGGSGGFKNLPGGGVVPALKKAPPLPVTPTPDTEKGKQYHYTSAYFDAANCDKAGCTQPFRGDAPIEVRNAPIDPTNGQVRCPTCRPGIYRYDDYHFVFVKD